MRPLLAAALFASAAAIGFAAVEAADPAPSAAPQKPEYGHYGFDEAGMDKGAAPGDDFYAYANGGWAKATPIPADKSNYGLFTKLDDLSKQRTKALLDAAQADPASRIGNAYAAYNDQALIEKKGLAPIRPWLDGVFAIKDKADYARFVGAAARNGMEGPFGGYVGQDDKAPETYIFGMFQGGLGLPDRDYYLSDAAEMAKVRDAYVKHLAKMLDLMGEKDSAARATAVFDFEMAVARVHWTRADSRDADKIYNKRTVAALQKEAPGFDFRTWLDAQALAKVDTLLVAQPSAVAGEAALIASTPIVVLRDQLAIRSVDGYAEVLPDAIDAENFAFYGTVLSGTPEREARWKRGINWIKAAMGEDIGQAYVAKYFPPEAKATADAMVKNIIAAMGRRIDGLAWMSAEAKQKAHAKLAAFTPKIGYPDKWRDYTGLQISRDDPFGNALRAAQFEHDYDAGKLGTPLRRWEWEMTPMEINAYANFGMVEIVFPAAILQPPFFDPHADPAVNYGGIGAVIGHELSHHFDDQGAKYDASGKLSQWWTDADVARFKALTDKLVAQYDQYAPLPDMHVNGQLTLGENIADLAGLTVAYDAYRASLGGKPAPVIDGTTGDERFYLGWAQVWRRNVRDAKLRQWLVTDPHSPSPYRVSTVRNLDPWYGAFKPTAGQKLYLKPEERVRIW